MPRQARQKSTSGIYHVIMRGKKQGDRRIVSSINRHITLEVKNMPRQARQKSISGIYHVIMRGINQQSIFEDDEDRLKFLAGLEKYKRISQCKIYAYCLMDNHVHLLIQEVPETIGLFIKRISSGYVIWYNGKHGRCGHLFQDRFKSEAVENESYFLTVLRYIHQNPIKANIATDIANYRWSSYMEYISGKKIIDREFALGIFAEDLDVALQRFVEFSNEDNKDNCLDHLDVRQRVSDDDVRKTVKEQLGIETIKICLEQREMQDQLLRLMKEIDGATVRQIARLTGLSAKRVWQA